MSMAHASAPEPTLRVAFCKGGAKTTSLEPREITFDELAAILTKPKVGEKDGPYYIRGGDLTLPQRANEYLSTADLVIIDGDSGFDPDTGEITYAPPMQEAAAVLEKLGLKFIAHTSYGYLPGERWKYRIVIPSRIKNQQQLDACVEFLMAKMHAAGVFLVNVKENQVWAQPWYLPRVAEAAAVSTFQSIVKHDGKELNAHDCLAWWFLREDEEVVERQVMEATPVRPNLNLANDHGPSIIETFNADHGLEWVRAELERNGYRFSHVDKAKGVYRYIRPGSETGIAGVMVFQGKHGDWCTYSHHGGQDPLSHKVCDPFELFAIFQCGGDRKAAAHALKPAKPKLQLATTDYGETPARQEPAAPKPEPKPAVEPPPPSRFAWITHAQGDRPVLNSNWLVKHVIPAEGLGVIFGRPGSGKTFSVMDISMHIAAGLSWRGKKVRQADVSYVSPEAGRLGVNRVIGWARHHGIAWPKGFRLSPAAINLCSDAADAEALIADIKQNQPNCRLVVIDTLNRAMAGGDENSGEDMGRLVALCDHIGKQLRAFVLIVHHSGKDAAKGSRGHSSLLGAVSLELEVTKEQGQPGTIKVTKMRDGEDGAEYGFNIDSVPLGVDEDGEEVTTGISLEADADEAKAVKAAVPKGVNQKTVADAFGQYVDDHGKPNPPGTGFAEPGRVRVVSLDPFIEFAAGKMVGGKPHEKRKSVREAVHGLVGKGYFAVNGGMIWRVK